MIEYLKLIKRVSLAAWAGDTLSFLFADEQVSLVASVELSLVAFHCLYLFQLHPLHLEFQGHFLSKLLHLLSVAICHPESVYLRFCFIAELVMCLKLRSLEQVFVR